MKVKMKLMLPGAKAPTRGSVLAAGYDLHACIEAPVRIAPGERALIPTGVALQIPPGYEMQVRPRSGLAVKNGLMIVNSPGTIDADYRGMIFVSILNTSKESYTIEHGDRIAQGVFARHETVETFLEVDDLDPTVRGAGAFGSTGKA